MVLGWLILLQDPLYGISWKPYLSVLPVFVSVYISVCMFIFILCVFRFVLYVFIFVFMRIYMYLFVFVRFYGIHMHFVVWKCPISILWLLLLYGLIYRLFIFLYFDQSAGGNMTVMTVWSFHGFHEKVSLICNLHVKYMFCM